MKALRSSKVFSTLHRFWLLLFRGNDTLTIIAAGILLLLFSVIINIKDMTFYTPDQLALSAFYLLLIGTTLRLVKLLVVRG